jgi:F5/8 type C domain/3-keto-disaccharide hydrolase/Fibronectin type III domain
MSRRRRGLALLAGATVLLAVGLTAAVANAGANAPAADVLLSRNKPVTASSSGGCCAAKNAVDGNSATRWASAAGKDPSWIYVDLGVVAQVHRIRLQWDKSCAVAYQLQTSTDHATWTTVFSTTSGKGGVEDRTGLTGSGRYVRMNGTKRCRADGSHGYSLQEFDVYGTTGGGGNPPTAPANVTQVSVTATSATVSWTASTGDTPIAGYDLFGDGTACGSAGATTTTGTCAGLSPNADHAITVTARDSAGNVSAPSAPLTVHTAPGGGGNPYGDPHLVSMFDGSTLGGWTPHAAGAWSVVGGAIHGNGTSRGWIYYNQQVGNFRWIFQLRQISGNHAPTVLIWGTTNPIRDALSGIQFQPPNGGHWDYRPGHNNGGGSEFKTFTHTKIDIHAWSQCELVGNMSTGVARMACCPLPPNATTATTCKGVEVLDFMDKTAGRVGPLAIQVHNSGIHDEYRGLWLDPSPANPNSFITT